MPKITVVGAGNVGATAAHIAATRDFAHVVLIDIVEGLAEGKALDIAQSGGVYGFGSRITGTCDWSEAKDSEIVIITSGMPRKPGMSRDDLLAKNVEIVTSVSEQVKTHCPDAFVIVVCNPLDAMVYTASLVTGFEHSRVMGMAGALDSARFTCFLSQELGICIEDIRGVLLGGHGDTMVPLPRFTTAGGIPVTELLPGEKVEQLVERTRKGGIEIVNLLGYSAYYAPAAGAVKMAEAIVKDKKQLFSLCAYCGNEYGIDGAFVGVPAILGAKGVEKILTLDLNAEEKAQLESSVSHVRGLMEKVDSIMGKG